MGWEESHPRDDLPERLRLLDRLIEEQRLRLEALVKHSQELREKVRSERARRKAHPEER